MQMRPALSDGSRFASMAAVAGLHVVAIYLLLLSAPVRHVVTEASAFMVTLVREPAEQQNIRLPKLKPVQIQQFTLDPVPVPQIAIANARADISPAPLAPVTPPPALMAIAPPSDLIPPQFDADYLDNPAPAYPPLSRRIREQGKVMLRVFVDANGAANQLEIKLSSGSQRLDAAALDAVRHWRFAPAKQGDKFVAAWVLVPINFSLRS